MKKTNKMVLAARMIELTNVDYIMEATGQMFTEYMPAGPRAKEQATKFMTSIREPLCDMMVSKLIPSIVRTFTEKELEVIVKDYESGPMSIVMKKQKRYYGEMQKEMPEIMDWIQTQAMSFKA